MRGGKSKLSDDGGFSLWVIIPLLMTGFCTWAYYQDNLQIKIIASVIVGIFGLIKCIDYQWLG